MANHKSYVDIDMLRNQLLNAVLHSAATAAINAALTIEGQIGYDLTLHRPKYYTGSVIREIASLDGTETLTNKTLVSPTINSWVNGSAIVTYGDGGIGTDLNSCSDVRIPSEKAVFAAISSMAYAGEAMVYKGDIDCSQYPKYPEADAGHTYKVSGAGKIGGENGPAVEIGDTLICTEDDTPVDLHEIVGDRWTILQYNIDILPTARGGTGSVIYPNDGDLLIGNVTNNSFTVLPCGEEDQFLRVNGGLPEWAYFYSIYLWTLSTSEFDHEFYQGHIAGFSASNGVALSVDNGADYINLTFGLAQCPGNTILANASASMAVPSGFSVTSSGVIGRLATGNLTNIPFGTTANTVAWGDHTHAQLHNQVHALVGSDHTVSGLTAGNILIATGATTFAWSAITMPNACSQGDLLYASASNTWTALAKSTTAGHFLKNTGANNNPAWGAITLSDLPTGLAKYYVASYESGGSGTNTMTITAATHGCGLKPMVQFLETNGTTDYRVATAQIVIDQATGDITVSTNISLKGKVIIMGS